jgi:hypothetical protein
MPAGADSDGALRADVPSGCYLSEKANFTLIHLEGDPTTIGRNHGALLADKIERGIAAYAHCSSDWYGLTWAQCRKNAVFYWPNVPAEYQQEIQGIADGAASQGVTNPDGATVDWIDILAYNAIWDIWWRLSLPGNKFWWLPFRDDRKASPLLRVRRHREGLDRRRRVRARPEPLDALLAAAGAGGVVRPRARPGQPHLHAADGGTGVVGHGILRQFGRPSRRRDDARRGRPRLGRNACLRPDPAGHPVRHDHRRVPGPDAPAPTAPTISWATPRPARWPCWSWAAAPGP